MVSRSVLGLVGLRLGLGLGLRLVDPQNGGPSE